MASRKAISALASFCRDLCRTCTLPCCRLPLHYQLCGLFGVACYQLWPQVLDQLAHWLEMASMRSKSTTSLWMHSISAEWIIRPSRRRTRSRVFSWSLRSVLRRMGQRPFVLEHARQVSAIDPPAAGRTADEMLGLVLPQACRRARPCIVRAVCRAGLQAPSSSPRIVGCDAAKTRCHVAAGWALISDQPRLVLQRLDPDHLVHRGLAAWHAILFRLFERFDTQTSLATGSRASTSVNASWSGLVAALRPVCF